MTTDRCVFSSVRNFAPHKLRVEGLAIQRHAGQCGGMLKMGSSAGDRRLGWCNTLAAVLAVLSTMQLVASSACPPGAGGVFPVCNACSPGKFSSAQGWTSCQACHAGKFGTGYGLTSCTACDDAGATVEGASLSPEGSSSSLGCTCNARLGYSGMWPDCTHAPSSVRAGDRDSGVRPQRRRARAQLKAPP